VIKRHDIVLETLKREAMIEKKRGVPLAFKSEYIISMFAFRTTNICVAAFLQARFKVSDPKRIFGETLYS